MTRAEKFRTTTRPYELLPHVLRFEHQLSRLLRILQIRLDLAAALTSLGALTAQLFERTYAALIARAARLDALADPRLFLPQFLVEQRRVARLDFKRVAFAQQIVIVAAGPGAQHAPIQLDDAAGHMPHEGAIVADEQQRARKAQDELLQPGDGLDVQMVGRLIQQQQIRITDQCTPQQDASAPTAGQGLHIQCGVQIQRGHRPLDALLNLPRLKTLRIARKAGGNDFLDPLRRQYTHLLRKHRNTRTRANPHLAAIGFDLPGDQFQQRGFALTVAAEQTQALATTYLQVDAIQKRAKAVGQGNLVEARNGHGCVS